MTHSTNQRAISFLLQPPAVEYLYSLQSHLKDDPTYLTTHREDVGNILHGFLSGAGLHWTDDIFQREWPLILEEALARLQSTRR